MHSANFAEYHRHTDLSFLHFHRLIYAYDESHFRDRLAVAALPSLPEGTGLPYMNILDPLVGVRLQQAPLHSRQSLAVWIDSPPAPHTHHMRIIGFAQPHHPPPLHRRPALLLCGSRMAHVVGHSACAILLACTPPFVAPTPSYHPPCCSHLLRLQTVAPGRATWLLAP